MLVLPLQLLLNRVVNLRINPSERVHALPYCRLLSPVSCLLSLRSMAASCFTRRSWRPPASNGVANHARTIRFACASGRRSAPKTRTFASLCARLRCASNTVWHAPARMPGTLFATIAIPIPDLHNSTPRSNRPPDRLRDLEADGGIVAGFRGMRPQIRHFAAEGAQHGDQRGFQRKPAMVGSDRHPQRPHLKTRRVAHHEDAPRTSWLMSCSTPCRIVSKQAS